MSAVTIDSLEDEIDNLGTENNVAPTPRKRGRPRKDGSTATTPRKRSTSSKPNYSQMATEITTVIAPISGNLISLITAAAFGLHRRMAENEATAISYGSLRMSLRRILPKIMPYIGGDLSKEDLEDTGMIVGASIAYFQRTAGEVANERVKKNVDDYAKEQGWTKETDYLENAADDEEPPVEENFDDSALANLL